MQQDNDHKRGTATASGSPSKKPYATPRLKAYGKLRDISMGEKGRTKIDGDPGPANTKR